jgi:hypothetical protein
MGFAKKVDQNINLSDNIEKTDWWNNMCEKAQIMKKKLFISRRKTRINAKKIYW